MLGLPYAVALGVWVGLISSIIPVIGTYLAGALPIIIALSGSPRDAIWVVVAIVVYQQVENYLIAPRITAHTLSLHPAIAFVSVLVGGALMGPAGALLALPATAIGGGPGQRRGRTPRGGRARADHREVLEPAPPRPAPPAAPRRRDDRPRPATGPGPGAGRRRARR